MIITDEKRKIEVKMRLWNGSKYEPDCTEDMLIDSSYNFKNGVYHVDNVQDVIDYVKDWERYQTESDHDDPEMVEEEKKTYERIAEITEIRRMRDIRMLTGLSQAAFAEKYNIPKRSIESWEATTEAAKREAPEYVLDLLERAVKEEINGRKGKWIPYKYDMSAEKVWRECDQCNTAYQLYTTYDDYNGRHNIIPLKMNFCPNCGADMR